MNLGVDGNGIQGVVTMPPNTSLILADSRYRENADTEEPADFVCRVSSAVAVKEIFYRQLVWNQPIFAHHANNAEVRFQFLATPDDINNLSPVFVTYASPFQCFRNLDGNAPGSVFLPPQQYSYAYQMETAFNWDARLLTSNLAPLPHPYTKDIVSGLDKTVRVSFRLNPARGFALQANFYDYNTLTYGDMVQLRILNCSWIRKAHYVHGFGVLDPVRRVFVPEDEGFAYTIQSNDAPNLMPSRYVVIQSPELTRDRRTPSFHSTHLSGFTNELAILPLKMENTCTFHANGVREDATVVSLREAYQPSVFEMIMKDEYGNVLDCDDPIGRLLNTPGFLSIQDVQSFTSRDGSNVYAGRGNSRVINYLIFGRDTNSPNPGSSTNRYWLLWKPIEPESGIDYGLRSNGSLFYSTVPFDGPTPDIDAFYVFPANSMSEAPSISATPDGSSQWGSALSVAPTCTPLTVSPTQPLQQTSIYYWNPQLSMSWILFADLTTLFKWETTAYVNSGSVNQKLALYFVLLAADSNVVYGYFSTPVVFTPVVGGTVNMNFMGGSLILRPRLVNAGFFAERTSVPFRIGIGIHWPAYNSPPAPGDYIQGLVHGNAPLPNYQFRTPPNAVAPQTEYIDPETAQRSSAYRWGNPNAVMLCEDVIHEMSGIIEFN